MATASPWPAELLKRAAKITTLVLDVDGVLTDGRIVYAEYGDELKFFDVQDGAGLVFWHYAGLRSAIITARRSRLLKRRAKEMRVDFLAQGRLIKLPIYEDLLKRWRLSDEQVCCIGDDLMELPLLRRVGLAVCVPSAVEDVKELCHYVTRRPAGRGAVREIVDAVLRAKGLWETVLQRYR
jgi:3-deoxy-D-manno-octulosonate 8-phosphate phosphatase (KDO 8-P phosphatase)